MDETKHTDASETTGSALFKGLGYGIGLVGGAALILYLFPGFRETVERIAMSVFG